MLSGLTGGGASQSADTGSSGGGLQDLLGSMSFAQITDNNAAATNPLQGLVLAQKGAFGQQEVPNAKEDDGFDDQILISEDNVKDKGFKDALTYDPLS